MQLVDQVVGVLYFAVVFDDVAEKSEQSEFLGSFVEGLGVFVYDFLVGKQVDVVQQIVPEIANMGSSHWGLENG